MKRTILLRSITLLLGSSLFLAACGDPYDPGDRALSGGVIGGGAGAAIGALAGGPAIGAVAGAALGAGTGALTTPNRRR
ncbi:hypothetical protein [Entomobacter blattae]|uniref:Cell envelope biogenesis protein OmpA n=1 Tax=Entomobacter blattae TaxID=2762277 RepID=A0A7H1NUT3_9PROT|nr:hypothetical protein [Entomobacter blattae]QNT79543.1 hypothetical protein JGUZn3_23430 [Entomobacter blattae]